MILNEQQIAELKKTILSAYKRFDKFCVDNDIKYFVSSGTAIGAIRHKGFIPWDDDFDTYMMAQECKKLKGKRDLISKYDLELYFPGDKNYWFAYPKIGIPNTTHFCSLDHDLSIGLSIDIFPQYEVDGTIETINQQVKEYKKRWYRYQCAITCFPDGFFLRQSGLKSFIKQTLKCLYFKPQKKFLFSRWQQYDNKMSDKSGDKITCFSGYWSTERELYQKEWFCDVILMPFEDTMVPMPVGYDGYLSTLYQDYMTPPPIEKRTSTHTCYYLDFNHRYTLKEVKKLLKNKN